MTTLTKEEKIQIINTHRKGLSYSKYNLEIDSIQENAKSSPDLNVLGMIESQLLEITNQLTALDAEALEVNSLAE